jgi:hypothetical protein
MLMRSEIYPNDRPAFYLFQIRRIEGYEGDGPPNSRYIDDILSLNNLGDIFLVSPETEEYVGVFLSETVDPPETHACKLDRIHSPVFEATHWLLRHRLLAKAIDGEPHGANGFSRFRVEQIKF